MTVPSSLQAYRKHTADLLKQHERKEAMSLAVGGNFEAVGRLEYFLLLQHGLQANHMVVDVGCGSGRLAVQLRPFLSGRYVGIDIVPELLQYADASCGRTDWKFYAAPGLSIPEPDETADFVCFFSVFTHLRHEESYAYLEDARRVLKPGGRITFSFLDFSIARHWTVFEATVRDRRPERVLNQFMGRDAIQAWTAHLDLTIIEIADGDKPHILLGEPVRWEDGREMTGTGLAQPVRLRVDQRRTRTHRARHASDFGIEVPSAGRSGCEPGRHARCVLSAG